MFLNVSPTLHVERVTQVFHLLLIVVANFEVYLFNLFGIRISIFLECYFVLLNFLCSLVYVSNSQVCAAVNFMMISL